MLYPQQGKMSVAPGETRRRMMTKCISNPVGVQHDE
jgi:hypothetical protein